MKEEDTPEHDCLLVGHALTEQRAPVARLTKMRPQGAWPQASQAGISNARRWRLTAQG